MKTAIDIIAPWSVYIPRMAGHAMGLPCVLDAKGRTIAEPMNHERDGATCEAQAVLMAAAPPMRAALIPLVERARALWDERNGKWDHLKAEIDAADSALALAGGAVPVAQTPAPALANLAKLSTAYDDALEALADSESDDADDAAKARMDTAAVAGFALARAALDAVARMHAAYGPLHDHLSTITEGEPWDEDDRAAVADMLATCCAADDRAKAVLAGQDAPAAPQTLAPGLLPQAITALRGVIEGGSWHDDGSFVYWPGETDEDGHVIDADEEGAIGEAETVIAAYEAGQDAAPQTPDVLALSAAERDVVGRALSDRMSIALATRQDDEHAAATRLHMRLQGLKTKPDASAMTLAALKGLLLVADYDESADGADRGSYDAAMAAAETAIAVAEGRAPQTPESTFYALVSRAVALFPEIGTDDELNGGDAVERLGEIVPDMVAALAGTTQTPDYEALARAAGWSLFRLEDGAGAADVEFYAWRGGNVLNPEHETAAVPDEATAWRDACERDGLVLATSSATQTPAPQDDADAGPTPPMTDDIGRYLRDAMEIAPSPSFGTQGGPPLPGCIPDGDGDTIMRVDMSDPSNLRLHMESGALFVVRIIREG